MWRSGVCVTDKDGYLVDYSQNGRTSKNAAKSTAYTEDDGKTWSDHPGRKHRFDEYVGLFQTSHYERN